jgi:hypothetical protein
MFYEKNNNGLLFVVVNEDTNEQAIKCNNL